MPRPTASVVLCARNAAVTLAEQLDALARQTTRADDVVVVDNGSTDATATIAAAFTERIAELRVVACPVPGLNRARNVGVRAASGTYVLFCDADDVVHDDWVGAMVAALDTSALVGGRLDLDSLNPPSVVAQQVDPTGDGLPRWFEMPYAVGANLGMRREVFVAIGGFDEAFELGSDEIDFCLRARACGHEARFAPDAVVAYRFKTTPRAFLRQYTRYGAGNAQLYAKHVGIGTVPPRPASLQGRSYLAKGSRAAKVWRAASADHRYTYLRDLGMFLGTNVGLVRYHLVV